MPIIMGKSPALGVAPSSWASKLAQKLKSRNVPKVMVGSLLSL